MRIEEKQPPRKYKCGLNQQIEIADCGSVYLDANEQLTFKTPTGKEHDFCRKSWGYYATPSVNGRLKDQGFKTALVKNKFNKFYVLVVDADCLEDFNAYIAQEEQVVVEWLDQR